MTRIEKGGKLIESNREKLAEEKRIEQSNKCKRSCTAYITHLARQINAVRDLMSDYSNKFQIRDLLSKF